MKIRCPQCDALHTFDEEKLTAAKLQGKAVQVKCKKCAHPFYIQAENLNGQPGSATRPLPPEKKMPEKRIIDALVQEKNEDAVVKTLYDGIVRYVNQKKFREAEGLRNQLMKIAPMALSEIFSTGEMIEQQKTMGMDPERIKPWAGLYDTLNPSEAVAFYYALSDFDAKAGIPVFSQGEFDDKLYFVYSGRLKLSYYDTELGRHFSYGDLHKGDVVGSDAFFSFSCHTSTLTPVVDSQLLFLEKSTYDSLLDENPALESKLTRYFGANIKTCNLSSKRGQARRVHKRYPVSLNAQIQMADGDGNRIIGKEITNVKIVDISGGGLCYVVQNLKKQEAEQLHKQWVHMNVQYKKDHVFQEVKTLAQIVSLKLLPFEECSIHVRFKKAIDEKRILEMVHSSDAQG
ncbi:MAG: cyclic nucleotide-binding domain-containing protein [Desulfosalsimonadaceae bacterium]